MMFFLVFSLLISQTQTVEEAMWELRAGNIVTASSSLPRIATLYLASNYENYQSADVDYLLEQISNGNKSLLPILTSLFVSEGNVSLAEFYWHSAGQELPASRIQLLELLAWFGRYKLYPLISLSPPVPPDLLETQYSNDCAAICAIGWMSLRSDGLFHGDQLVSEDDLQLLFRSFPEIDHTQTDRTITSLELFIEEAFYTGGSY